MPRDGKREKILTRTKWAIIGGDNDKQDEMTGLRGQEVVDGQRERRRGEGKKCLRRIKKIGYKCSAAGICIKLNKKGLKERG